MLERVGLSDSAGVQLRKFSKGMLQRVGLAQAILHDPKLVFLDEPMSGLDPMGRREVRDLIQQLRSKARRFSFRPTFCRTPRRFATGWPSSTRVSCAAWERWRT
jgi:ABC-type Na+ transport system ATPase subunit NatA